MTKNTTDELREQIYKIFRELGVPSADSGGMEKPYVVAAADEILDLISNREKLARIEAYEHIRLSDNGMQEPLKTWLDGFIDTLRKELDGEEPTNE